MSSLTLPETLTLETVRLQLRLMNPDVYRRLFAEHPDETIKAFMGLPSDEALATERERYKNGITTFNKSFSYFFLVEKVSDTVLGWCGFHTWYTNHNRAELGYQLNEETSKNKGYMSEALPLIIRYGFETMNLHRIEAMIGPGNVPSLKLVRKFGFKEEGLMRAHYLKDGVYQDSIIFSLIRTDIEIKVQEQ